ncbi:ABC transporter ATP-binding protein [Streptomyces sp. 549]|uniref:ABC transporter ATP-binding protein n=1 Tax=Streptomyces sp. 549 TaxID=3049076 RepID=UPI0024C36226|nr:ABC transporter ATP-binding protein [Streptomyces sp. 549]MDK1474659.1 ABC transporter ATP-binding protein [Streptomyces sp. 549]
MQIRDLPFPDPGDPDVRSGPRFLLWLGRSQWGGQAKALGWGTLHMAAVASLPVVVGLAVQAVIDRSGARLATAGVLLLIVGTAVTVGDTMLHRVAVTNWITAAARVQQLLARRTAELGATLTRRVAAGEVVAVSTGDIEKIGWCVESVSRFSAALLATVGVCTGLIVYEPRLGLLVAGGVLLLALTVLPLLPRATRRADRQRDKAGRATELAADTVAGLRVLRGVGGEELFLDRYRRASQEVREAAVTTARMWAVIDAVQVALPGLLLISVVWQGTTLASQGNLGVGELVTVYGAVIFLLFPLRNLQEFAMAWSFARPSARRTARVLALRRAPADAAAKTSPTAPASASASAPASTAATTTATATATATGDAEPQAARLAGDLYDPASGLLAPAGALTAVVCGDPDTAGRLAERLGGHPADNPGAPSVLLGGTALGDRPLGEARGAVLVQDKDPVLLSGTLTDLLDVPCSGEVSAVQALDAAQCADVLDALARSVPGSGSDPMRVRITERGRSLSGGQRQRLALARSLRTDPEVLVLDEPTSAVDSHTEARIAEGLVRLRQGRTTVVFTSSPLLLDRADRVVLVSEGSVTAAGEHRALLRTEPAYRWVVTRETDEELTEGMGSA